MVQVKMPWIDRDVCVLNAVNGDCKAAQNCPREALQVVESDNGSSDRYRIFLDFDRCRFCGDCAHACPESAIKMV
ncbi:MAG: 4Fe-4S binding protein [Actinomycetota bacterium]|nr:4Fe-4S binding protein [Actinomycetota bacterium]